MIKYICTPPPAPPSPSDHALLYLSGGSNCSGVVQVQNAGHTYFLSGSHSTWHQDSANVVCRHLGCGARVSFTTVNATDPQRMRSYNCSSREDSLFDCPMTEGQTEGANQSEVAFVTCSGMKRLSIHVIHRFFISSLKKCLYCKTIFCEKKYTVQKYLAS